MPNEIQFFRVEDLWRRRNADGFGCWVAYDGDMSPVLKCNTNYLLGRSYNADCGHCGLGHAHSTGMHVKNLKSTAQQCYAVCAPLPMREHGMHYTET